MKKIRLVVNAIPLANIKTGIGTYIQGLYSRLEQISDLDIYYFDGHTVRQKFPSSPDLNKWSKRVDLFWKLPARLAYGIRLFFHIKREKIFEKLSKGFDLYHETAFFPFKTSLPTVFTVHDLSVLRFPEFHPRERVLYFNRYFKKRLKRAAFVLTVSEFTKRELIKHVQYPGERIQVTHLGYDQNIFRVYPRQQTDVTLKKYQIKDPFFVFIGTNDPRKNLKLLEKCAPYSKYPIYLIGWQGWRRQSFGSKLIPLGYIPKDRELAHILNRARALIYPSIYEGFGLPVLEAMACGCPVVVSTRASLPEVAGEAGIYLQKLSEVKELLEIMHRLVVGDDFWRKYSNKALKRAKFFSWENTAKQTLEVFKKTMIFY